MRRLLIPLLVLLSALPALADGDGDGDPDGKQERVRLKRLVERYQDDLLANERTLDLDGLQVRITVVPDYFMVLALEELLEVSALNDRDPDELRDRLDRLAKRRGKKTMGVPAVFFRFQYRDTGRRDFFCFQGKLNDCLRARALGQVRFTPADTRGDGPTARTYMLFKPHRSEAWKEESNGRPHFRRTLNVFGRDAFEVRFLVKKGFSERAEELEISVGNLIHVQGRGITEEQIDFKNGATASYARGQSAEFPLPVRPPELPEALADLMPEWQD
jgi:hypothetical protein